MADLELTIDQLVGLFLPAGFSVTTEFQNNSIKVWQLYLWPQFPEVVEADQFTLSAYPESSLPLFAALVVHDVLTLALTANFLDQMGSAGSTEGSEAGGGIKAIKTGPTEVEFHDGLSSLAKLIASTKDGGGILGELREKACMFARQLGISLPFCIGNGVRVNMIKGGIKVPNVARAILRRP